MQNDQSENVQTPLNSDLTFEEAARALSEELRKAHIARKVGKTSMADMMGHVLQTSLAEIQEYTELIKHAKTKAKADYYQKKIRNVSKRLSRMIGE